MAPVSPHAAAAVAISLLLVLAALLPPVAGHAMLVSPLARNACPSCNNYCPHCLNAGGPGWVSAHTPSGAWPADGIETPTTSVRHGLCGNAVTPTGPPYSFDAPTPPAAVFTSGGAVSFEVAVTAHHRGHFQFALCTDADALTQECLDAHPLLRTQGADDTAPFDAAHPERWYLPPNGAGTYTNIRFRLPDVACVHCVIQWWYVTANSCNPPGYAAFFGARPELSAWWTSGLGDCGRGPYPEEFWNCVDVTLTVPDGVSPSTTPSHSVSPSATATVSVTPSVTPTVSTSPTVAPSPLPPSASASAAPPGVCSGCWGHTEGPCQQSNGVCWAYLGGTTNCPVGTSPCGSGSPPSPSPSASVPGSASATASASTSVGASVPSERPLASPSGSATTSPPPATVAQCAGCWGLTAGPCKAPSGVCWAFLPGTTLCPVGTSPCGVAPPSASPSRPLPASPSASRSPGSSPPPSASPSVSPGTALSESPSVSPSTAPPAGRTYRKKVVAYYTNWAQYRPAPYRFFPEDVRPELLTHAVFAFATVTRDYAVAPFEWNDVVEWNPPSGMYHRFNAGLKAVNPRLRTLVALGGWNFNYLDATKDIFTTMAASPAARSTFAASCIAFCREHGFDGVDVDWEYPGHVGQGGRPQDKANFVALLADMRAAFHAEAVATGHQELLLSIAVAAGPSAIADGYDIPNIHAHVDWVGLMSYDLHGSWDAVTGHHTGLYDTGDGLSVAGAVTTWRNGGTPANKLVMGVATYGRAWRLAAGVAHVGAAAAGAASSGTFTREAGFWSTYEIQARLDAGWTRGWDAHAVVPYAYGAGEWVSYDDAASMGAKLAYVDAQDLAGVMVWALDLDEFRDGAYPLVRQVSNHMAAATPSPAAPTAAVSSSSPSVSPSPSPSASASAGARVTIDAHVVLDLGNNQRRRRRLTDGATAAALGLVPDATVDTLPATTLAILRYGLAEALPHAVADDVTVTAVTVTDVQQQPSGSGAPGVAQTRRLVVVAYRVDTSRAVADSVQAELQLAVDTSALQAGFQVAASRLSTQFVAVDSFVLSSVQATDAAPDGAALPSPAPTTGDDNGDGGVATHWVVVVGGVAVVCGLAVGALLVVALHPHLRRRRADAGGLTAKVSPRQKYLSASPVGVAAGAPAATPPHTGTV